MDTVPERKDYERTVDSFLLCSYYNEVV